jgi:FAD/FMN-containing dehydrogenase
LECQGTPLAREAKEPEIWVEAGGSKAVADRIARELEAVGKAAGAPLERQDAETARAGWDRIANFGNWLRETDPALVVLKATLPDSASEEFLSRAQQEAENEKVRLASLVQMGVGVVLLALWEEKPAPECALLLARLRTAAETLGGALVIEHCPADLKAEMEAWGKPGDDFDLMKKVKAAWDPKGILSPGRFVGGL